MRAHEAATVDVEALARRELPTEGINVWAYDAGQPWPHRVAVTSLQVDVRASTKERARARADHARAVMLDLPHRRYDDAVIATVDVVTGPLWMPDETGAPRYVLRVSVRAHPRALSPAAPVAGARPAQRRRRTS